MKTLKFSLRLVLASGILFGSGAAQAGKYLQRVETSSAPASANKKPANKKLAKSSKGKLKSAKADNRDEAFQKANSPKLSRDLVFTGTDINGKYLAAGELASTVETEKSLNRLIGMRKDFRDRMAAERERLKAAGNSPEGN